MIELLKIEFLKVRHYTVLRAFLLLFIILLPFAFFSLSMIKIPLFPSDNQLFGFPGIWSFLTFVASFFNIFPALLLIVLVCNEITYKTEKQNVIDGLSRKQVILSKFYVLCALTLFVTVFVFLVGLIFGSIYSHIGNVFWGIEKLLYFTIQTFGYLSMALLFAVLLRRTSLAVLGFMVVFFLAGLILSGTMEEMAQWTPVNMLNDLTPQPFFSEISSGIDNLQPASMKPFELEQWMRALLSLAYTFGFVVLANYIMKKRDL